MKHTTKFVLLLILLVCSVNIFAAELTHKMTAEEQLRKDQIGKDFYETDPPEGPVRNIAEFEPMEAVIVSYPFGIPVSLIAEMSEDAVVTTIVSGSSEENTVTGIYNSNGVNLDNCNFLHAPSDSYWTRDYGPWFVVDGNYDVGIVNFPYNRPRPNDNDIPIEVADFMNIELYGMNLIHTGGNYMTDGHGVSASSRLVIEENSYTEAEINQLVNDYLGIDTYHLIEDPNNTYIDHIDCWSKFLDVDKVLIRSVPESHPQYDEIEETAAYFAQQTSSYGVPYQIYRVYTPQDQPYTNSLILNDKVFVPVTGSSYDSDALEVYEEAMPGYEIIGISDSGSDPWQGTDALHCRTRGLADREMLYIAHMPILGNVDVQAQYEIEAEIIPYSGEPVVQDSVMLYYKINNGDFTNVVMQPESENTYTAVIDGLSEGDNVYYYLYGVDEAGNNNMHPFIGSPDPHIFHLGIPDPAELVVNPESFDVALDTESSTSEILELTNNGDLPLDYTIQLENTDYNSKDISGSYMETTVEDFTPGETTSWDFSVFNASPDNEWLTDVSLEFPAGITVNSATDLTGGTGDLVYDGTTGNGATINWNDPDGSYGEIYPDETASCEVEVAIDAGFADDAVLEYEILGDEWGSAPHSVSGTITIESAGEPITWLSLDVQEGSLAGNETDEIEVSFNSYDLSAGTYNCNIVISDSREETIIPVTLTVEGSSADINEIANLTLSNYPNPFNPETTISFEISEHRTASIDIYNLKGQKVKSLINKELKSGSHSIVWNGTDENGNQVPSGVYFYKLNTGEESVTKKMLLLK